MSENNPDIPDTPPDVLARQSAARPLTPQTAELIGAKSYMNDGGKMVGDGYTEMVRQNSAALKARQRAEAFVGGSPLKGIPEAQVFDIKGRAYEDAPVMDPETGDRGTAFVNWLWANKPDEAKVRYAYRDIWPTALPEVWPAVAAPISKIVGPHSVAPVTLTETDNKYLQEIDRLKAELAARADHKPLVNVKRRYKPRAKVRAEVQPAPATTTTV